jgi:dTDP-4-amino-4,6-dideoxygalactose transaminase
MTETPFLRPTFPDVGAVAAEYADIVANGIYSNGGPKHDALAAAMAQFIGGGVHVALAASATAGLQLACSAAFRPGRWVIVTSFTFAAGPLAIRWAGFEPLFIDVDPMTWQPSLTAAASVLERVGPEVAGILLTTTFGVVIEEIAEWEVMAARHGVPLLIDAAAGFGSAYSTGERAGNRGACEIFSLHATKTFAIGEGGAISSADVSLVERVRRMANFGFDGTRGCVELGANAKLAELPSAIGLRQLVPLPARIASRQEIMRRYVDELGSLGFEFQPGAERSALPFVSVLAPDAAIRDRLIEALTVHRIGCRTYYSPPVHRQPYFENAPRVEPLIGVETLCSRVISLPMADGLGPDAPSAIAAVARVVYSHA